MRTTQMLLLALLATAQARLANVRAHEDLAVTTKPPDAKTTKLPKSFSWRDHKLLAPSWNQHVPRYCGASKWWSRHEKLFGSFVVLASGGVLVAARSSNARTLARRASAVARSARRSMRVVRMVAVLCCSIPAVTRARRRREGVLYWCKVQRRCCLGSCRNASRRQRFCGPPSNQLASCKILERTTSSSTRDHHTAPNQTKMILTTCAACAAPLAHDAPRCVRCKHRRQDTLLDKPGRVRLQDGALRQQNDARRRPGRRPPSTACTRPLPSGRRARKIYAKALYRDDGATLNDLREAVTSFVETERTARRVFGGSHPYTTGIEEELRLARAVLRVCETPGSA